MKDDINLDYVQLFSPIFYLCYCLPVRGKQAKSYVLGFGGVINYFCSLGDALVVFKGYKQTDEHKSKKAKSLRRGSYFNCLICSCLFWRQPSAIKKGDCKFCSRDCYRKWQSNRPKSEQWKKKRIENNMKKAVFLTKHRLRRFLQGTNKYKNWRNEVFKRDDWTCQKCMKKGVYVEAHHIKPFALFPELRFEISNGKTLCKPCHSKEPKGKEIYGIKH